MSDLHDICVLQAQVKELTVERNAFKKECDVLRHQVITCGVAATHSDPDLTRTGSYSKEWNSAQAEMVRELRTERDELKKRIAEATRAPINGYRNNFGRDIVSTWPVEANPSIGLIDGKRVALVVLEDGE